MRFKMNCPLTEAKRNYSDESKWLIGDPMPENGRTVSDLLMCGIVGIYFVATAVNNK